MNIHEHQARSFSPSMACEAGQGFVGFTPDEIEKAAAGISTPTIVVKAQIHAGGRGKGKFKEPAAGDKGGVRFAKSAAEARTARPADARQYARHHSDRGRRRAACDASIFRMLST